jgi:hypothetical protein
MASAAAPAPVPVPVPARVPPPTTTATATATPTPQPSPSSSSSSSSSSSVAPPGTRIPSRPPPLPAGAGRPAASVPGMSDDDLAALHRRYHEAARNTDRPAPSLERMKEQLSKHLPALREQLGTDRVTFEVVVKDGRVVLRPKPQT